MSKFLWITSRNSLSSDTRTKLLNICAELVPDNIVPNEPLIQISSNVAYGIANPKNNILFNLNSLLIGTLIGEYPNWHVPQSEFPDGTFALFRENEDYAEVVADPAASRTIWYYFDDTKLIASTSQLAIVRYLENFEFNVDAVAWMLSSGTLGPNLSWDKRLKRIMPDCSILLEKKSWKIKNIENPIEFKLGNKNKSYYEGKLRKTLNDVFNKLNIDLANWVLPLSGGYDSRSLLYFLFKKQGKKIKAITWGLEASLHEPENDAYIAKKLAEETGIEHKYLHTDLSREPLDNLINRFIKNGEGRIDAISGYLDGFKLWADLHRQNVQGVLRGDVGWAPNYEVYSYLTSRRAVNLMLLQDYRNFKNFGLHFGNITQQIPSEIEIKKNEGFELWRDRLYHNYRIPTILAALSDLKLGYIEQANPLLSREILSQIREHPMTLRRKKFIFKKLVKKMFPKIPFAKDSAQMSVKNFTNSSEVSEYLKNGIFKFQINPIFPAQWIEKLSESIILNPLKDKKINDDNSFLMKRFSPKTIKLILKKILKRNERYGDLHLNSNILAFRVLLILKTYELFNEKYIKDNKNKYET